MPKKVPIMPVCHDKKFTVGDGEPVLFYTLLGFDGLQFSSQLLRFPQEGLAAMLHFRAKSEGLGKPAQKLNGSNIKFLAGLLEILQLTSGAVYSTTTSMRPAIVKTLDVAPRTCS